MKAAALLRSIPKEHPGADAEATRSGLINRNIKVQGRRTSMRLEGSMWDALKEICERERLTLAEVCTFAADAKTPALTLTAALRVLIANYFRSAATEEGHAKAGHGRSALMARAPLAAALHGDRPRPRAA